MYTEINFDAIKIYALVLKKVKTMFVVSFGKN